MHVVCGWVTGFVHSMFCSEPEPMCPPDAPAVNCAIDPCQVNECTVLNVTCRSVSSAANATIYFRLDTVKWNQRTCADTCVDMHLDIHVYTHARTYPHTHPCARGHTQRERGEESFRGREYAIMSAFRVNVYALCPHFPMTDLCRPNFCGGCFTDWLDSEGNSVQQCYDENSETTLSPSTTR